MKSPDVFTKITPSIEANMKKLKRYLEEVKKNDLFPGHIEINSYTRHGTRHVCAKEVDELNKRKNNKKWCVEWKLRELLHEIKLEDIADEDEYFCYITKAQALVKLHVSENFLSEIIRLGEKEKRVLVLKKNNETRICNCLVRKFPLELL